MTSIRIYDKTDDFGDRRGIFVPLVELRAALDKIEANA